MMKNNNGCGCLILAVLMIFAPQLFLLLAMVLGVTALLKYLNN